MYNDPDLNPAVYSHKAEAHAHKAEAQAGKPS
jgi:hypothetical protein